MKKSFARNTRFNLEAKFDAFDLFKTAKDLFLTESLSKPISWTVTLF